MSWGDELAAWWLEEVASDPAYRLEVLPLAMEMLAPESDACYLDLGCGEGRMMELVAAAGARVVGCDLSPVLASMALRSGPVAVARLPELEWVRPGSLDGAYLVLVLEHLAHIAPLMAGTAAAVRSGGVLVAVLNHPVATSPGSGPFIDPDDGEVLWRWGPYLEAGSSREPAGSGAVDFHHRPLGGLLSAAADAGWWLERMVEIGVGPERAAADSLLAVQSHIPRLLGIRWRRAASPT